MSITFMQEVVKIADRFFDRKDPDSIDRQGQLNQVLVIVVIFHAIMGISFVKMEEYERKHPRQITEVNVAFEFNLPPVIPAIKLPQMPPPMGLTEGENPFLAGSADANRKKPSKKVSIEAIKADETNDVHQRAEPARMPISHETTQLPPVAVTQITPIKSEPRPLPASATNNTESQIDGSNSTAPASGANYDASAPDEGKSNSIGKGGPGAGGSGEQNGTDGPGSSSGNIEGTKISTTLPSSHRAMLNIAPYRKKLLMQIGANWHPTRRVDVAVRFEVAKDGTAFNAEIVESSHNRKLDAEALAFIEGMTFPPLPEAYQGESLPFEIDLSVLKFVQ